MFQWTDMFSPRQLLCHGVGVEVFREMLDADVVPRAGWTTVGGRHTATWR